MSDSTNENAQNPILAGSDAPVAPDTAPETVSAELLTDDEAAVVGSVASPGEAADTTDDAETLAPTAAVASDDAETIALAAVDATGDAETIAPTAVTLPVMAAPGQGKRSADRSKRGPIRPEGPKPLGHYAVIETGGKQYRVSVGDRIAVERLEGDEGSEVTLDRVLMVGGDGAPQIGAPMLDGVAVTATIENQYRGEKIIVFKMKPKKRYRRRTGHRQNLTRLSITAINA